MINISKLHETLLKTIFNSSGILDVYTLFKRSKLDFSSFSKSLKYLIDQDILIENENHVSVNEKKITEVKSYIFRLKQDGRAWRMIPENMIGKNIYINSPYIPSRSILDKKAFQIN